MERKRIYKYVSVMLIYILHSVGIASYPWNVYCKETRFCLNIEIFYDWLSLHLVSQSVIKISHYWYLSLFVVLAFYNRCFVVWFLMNDTCRISYIVNWHHLKYHLFCCISDQSFCFAFLFIPNLIYTAIIWLW